MTSLRQIESNRRNALRSTGPKTGTGKQRSSQNSVRHGLTTETMIEPLEDPKTTKPSNRQSPRIMTPKRRSSANWSFGLRACYGDCGAQS
jgi:hypothetical protein